MKKNIIWNINKICAFDCSICCVDAFYVKKYNSEIIISSNSLVKPIIIERKSNSIFDEANITLQQKGLELTLAEKFRIIENIDIPITLDFSGGDPLILKENFDVIISASKKIGKDNISISTTGAGLSNINIDELKEFVSHIEFTYDFPGDKEYINRPNNYNKYNLSKIKLLSQLGIKTAAQISLTKENISKDIIRKIYVDLKNAKIDEIFLMKLFPVGRGADLINDEPTRIEYQNAVNLYKSLEKEFSFPKIVVQSILSYSESKNERIEEKFYISNSLNINNLGLLILSPWAYDNKGNPLSTYVLGNLIENKLSELYNSKSYDELYKRLSK